jgi:hypothetical protein
MVACWNEKVSARLQIEDVIKCLTYAANVWDADVPAFLLASEGGIAQAMSLEGREAQSFLDRFYEVTPFDSQLLTVGVDLQGRLITRRTLIHHLESHMLPGWRRCVKPSGHFRHNSCFAKNLRDSEQDL